MAAKHGRLGKHTVADLMGTLRGLAEMGLLRMMRGERSGLRPPRAGNIENMARRCQQVMTGNMQAVLLPAEIHYNIKTCIQRSSGTSVVLSERLPCMLAGRQFAGLRGQETYMHI